MPISSAMEQLILEGGDSMHLANQAQREGIKDLRQSGLLKAISGLTSLEEINRITTN
jgi:type IV pilus assembly protein PilB